MSSPDQMELLSWTQPEPVAAFDEAQIRQTTLSGRIARAVSLALKDCPMTREQVAAGMSDYLGEDVSKNMLDAYASVSREGHRMSVERLVALMHVTGDRRLLEMVASLFGWAVIERRFLKMIEIAAITEKEADLRRHRKMLKRQARNDGAMG